MGDTATAYREVRTRRNLVVCCDGTANEFGAQNTNVVRLVQILDSDPNQQLVYYDPGIGTLPEPRGLSWVRSKVYDIAALAIGIDLDWKVEQAYRYLMEQWQPGDRVFLFGFSRGAYTVRVLAGLLYSLGLLPRGNDNLVRYMVRLFKAAPESGGSGSKGSRYWAICNSFRATFARALADSKDRRFHVHFVGIWDTVSSVGWIWEPVHFPFTARNPGVNIVRHAISIDERRWFFWQNRMYQAAEKQDLQERWFPGVHSDVGGGYPEADGGLWRAPFTWIHEEARTAGLVIDDQRLEKVYNRAPPSPTPWDDQKHESLTAAWWPAEFFPKFQQSRGIRARFPRLGMGRHRFIPEGALIEESALKRIRDLPEYQPRNMSRDFIEHVRELSAVPATLPFFWSRRIERKANAIAEAASHESV